MKQANGITRVTLIVIVAAAIGVGPLGCAKVQPEADYVGAAERIKTHLDINDVYLPSDDRAVDEKVRALLSDGLSLKDAISIALLNNRAFQAQFYSIGVSRADVVQSGLWTNPSLFIGNRFIEGGGRSELTFGFAQNLVDLWQIPVKKRVAEAQLRQTVLAVLNEAMRTAVATRTLYYDCLWRRRLVEIARSNVELAATSLRIADARLSAGESSPLDKGLVRTQSLQSQNAALAAERDLENALLALLLQLGLTRWETDVQLIDPFSDSDHAIAKDDALIGIAIDRRFDIRIADALVDAAAQQVDLELRKIWPNITIGAQGERTEQRALPGRKLLADTARSSIAAGQPTAPAIQSRDQRDIMRNQIIDALFGMNIQLTLPIWDQNQAQIAKAGFVYKRRLKDREWLLDSMEATVRQAANTARTARRQYALFQGDILPQAESNITTAQKRYENGEESVLVLLEAQDAMFQQRRQSANLLRDLLVARAELDLQCGGGSVAEAPVVRRSMSGDASAGSRTMEAVE
ncbi:MAG TPA: TolC family protein [Phycisphaerae bacterium]|nr:TolC family protein [Phycisphaerae bacterium]HRW52575.1 TolC family protein [Phycisphaerae bacterium]